MRQPPLFLIYFVYHSGDERHVRPLVRAVESAFEHTREDRAVSDLEEIPDVRERVQFQEIPGRTAWDSREWKDDPTIPALFVVMVTDRLAREQAMHEILETIAKLLPENPQDGNCDLLSYTLSQTAIGDLPELFSKRQVERLAELGEHRIAPHNLGLVALHRARLLLGLNTQSNELKLFISHAKADGIFLAHALKSSIEKIPGLVVWYDAKDVPNGSDWISRVSNAASTSVFIAIRTNAYEKRRICREEFMTALHHGVPIVVVDALMAPVSDSSPLPFSTVPSVRVPDGNTYRVLLAALREHLRILLMQAAAAERAPADRIPRVWPRLPSPAAIRLAWDSGNAEGAWLVPKALCYDAEFLELRDWLVSLGSNVTLDHLETYRPSQSLT